ncbi:MAG: hypothetical protein MJY81_07195 [Bacteroidaceae bacterium]|nr:hypothetical protein [Bacteroidaceae bacterium]
MKKTITTILCTAIFAVLAVSCQKSIDSENPVEPTNPTERDNGTIDIRVNGLMGEYSQVDATRAVLVNNVRVSWEGDETVYVYDGTQCLGTLKASLEGTEDRYALLSTDDTHTVSTPASGTTTLTLVYSPLLTEAPTVSGGAISVSLASQSGEKAPFVAFATLDYTGTTITNAVVPFKFATSVIKVNCTGLKPGTAITSATLDNVNTKCKLTLSGSAAPTVSGDVNGTITRTGDAYFADSKVNSEGEAVFQIAVPKLETASGARDLTVEQGSDKFRDWKFTTSSLNPATSVNTVCQLGIYHRKAFSVSDRKHVYFSMGNLWYGKVEGETESALHFETNQWESTPSFNNQESGTMDPNHVSHFTWANTVEKAISEKDYDTDNLFCDENHKQSVDDSANIYYALSKEEWDYLLKERTMPYGKNRYSVATCPNSGVSIEGEPRYGLFLYPDDYSGNEVGTTDGPDTWDGINDAGIVFLPAAGHRTGYGVSFGYLQSTKYDTFRGRYWTSSSGYYIDDGRKIFMMSDIDICNDGAGTSSRQPEFGDCLRLVRDAQ